MAERISATVPQDYASALNVVYFPQLGNSHAFPFMLTVHRRISGFLICVPMLEEWQNGAEIEVLDGWSFQVGEHIASDNLNLTPCPQFSSE